MNTGIVKWFNDEKGFGFITNDSDNKDVFVYYSNINVNGYKTLEQGQKVTYELNKGIKGLEAFNVSITNK
ncbi:cold-shock protein [Mycoplasma mycoides]|uniref:'Cold-shock' DNA-binding domain protein n=1 Tax=Mycoplasma mycoides subsp. mycoides TaxID=2103 RepID=A0AAE2EHQ0_MYCMY|nr:cold-shock DNA-binding domain protein [Mycoplasma mycoides subsp. mycoides SC str. Gladysdale]AIZ54861.1 Cold shock-like protein CspG [Mycoplasma mycoides subsp. mycoides]PTD31298.1 Cold shock protein [Mycoplasma mycoides subsp. mycoides B345/93]PTD32000.1 Cold shock protein [Mycoplasma mycoides subsp. mycoides C425/93]PTD33085.1 Cold shock protein [Mycoplasma mycoides subsp. mycoides KH3J]PTD34338.1 cold shock protein [Mycoplasma mycoides subsp. mycoides PO-67]PTD34889.1 Cold shock protei